MRRILVTALGLGLIVACTENPTDSIPASESTAGGPLALGAATANSSATRSYEVTIYNLTGGQPFTPPLVATHKRPADVFTVGEAASLGVKEIAENGNLGPLAEALGESKHVSDVVIALEEVPPILPGASRTFSVDAGPGAKWLSWVSMLICTNDGFTGADSFRLPKRVGDQTENYTAGYDAGTEINTENYADIVPPCQGIFEVMVEDGSDMSDPALAEGGVITHHSGIQGGDDLDAGFHGWDDPVAKIVIERVS